MKKFLKLSIAAAMLGSVVTCLVVLAAALLYRGRVGEPFSLLNHFISELGEPGVSRGAWIFNAGLVVSGALFIPSSVGLGLRIGGLWSGLGIAAGVGAGVFCAGVGIFPMSRLDPHVFTAMWFFRCGLLMAALFGVAMLTQRRGSEAVPRAASLFSLVAVAAYGTFLVMAGNAGTGTFDTASPLFLSARPAVWTLAVLEWAVFFATVLWFLGVALLVSARGRGSAIPSGRTKAPPPRP